MMGVDAENSPKKVRMFLLPTLTFQNYPATFGAPFFFSRISFITSTNPVSALQFTVMNFDNG